MIHQEPVINALSDRDSILPHVIISMGSPMPIKLKVASEIIAVLTFMTTINMIDEKSLVPDASTKHGRTLLPYILLR